MNPDGQVTIGANYLPREIVSFGQFKYSAYSPFITINYLPFFEISIRITRLINYDGSNQAIGDRTVSTRIRILNENNYIPSVVVGFHDILGAFGGVSAIHNNALYIVTSKNIYFNSSINYIGIHIGYGTDKIKSQNHNFVGFFGGVSLKLFNTLELMNEYDGKHSNSGIRLKLFGSLSILGGLLQHKHFSGGAAFSFQL